MSEFQSETFPNIEVKIKKCADRKEWEEDEQPNHVLLLPSHHHHTAAHSISEANKGSADNHYIEPSMYQPKVYGLRHFEC